MSSYEKTTENEIGMLEVYLSHLMLVRDSIKGSINLTEARLNELYAARQRHDLEAQIIDMEENSIDAIKRG